MMTYLDRALCSEEEYAAWNRKLCAEYPFLLPRHWRTDEVLDDYDYTETLFDDIPYGWRRAFGLLMVKDIAAILKQADFLDQYRVVQIKEKFGELRWYDNGAPEEIYGDLSDTITKYEYISDWTCIQCGKFPALYRSSGWICPYCEQCAHELIGMNFYPVDTGRQFNPLITLSVYRDGTGHTRQIDCSDIIERMAPIQETLFGKETRDE